MLVKRDEGPAPMALLASVIAGEIQTQKLQLKKVAKALGRDHAFLQRILSGKQKADLATWQRLGRFLLVANELVVTLFMCDDLAEREPESYESLLGGRALLPTTPDERNELLRDLMARRQKLAPLGLLLIECLVSGNSLVAGVSAKLAMFLWARTLLENNHRTEAAPYFAAVHEMLGEVDLDVDIMLCRATLHVESGEPLAAIGYLADVASRESLSPLQLATCRLLEVEARVVARLTTDSPDGAGLQAEFGPQLVAVSRDCESLEDHWLKERCGLWIAFLRREPLTDRFAPHLGTLSRMASPRDSRANFVTLAGALALWHRSDDELEATIKEIVRKGEHGLASYLLVSPRRPARPPTP